MKLSELMNGRKLNPEFSGQITADDMVLAIDFAGGSDIGDYIVAQKFVAEHSGSIESETTDSQYIRTGKVTTRVGATRTIAVNGDRFAGDPFQENILSHAIKYGRGSDVVKDYVYFAIQTGKGERGQVTIDVGDDASGAAGEKASFSATLTSVGTPEEYTYEEV